MKNKIKEVALKLFATKGYERTTMREIGNEVGIRGSSIYSHFTSKEEIFLEVVHDLFVKMTWEDAEDWGEAYKDGDIDLKSFLIKVFKSYYFFFAQHELELLFWQRIRFFKPYDMEDKYDVNRLLYKRPVVEVYLDVFRQGMETKEIRGGDVGLITMSFFTFISGYTDSLILSPIRLSETQLEECFEIFWSGVKSK